jgi:hypothetical protein
VKNQQVLFISSYIQSFLKVQNQSLSRYYYFFSVTTNRKHFDHFEKRTQFEFFVGELSASPTGDYVVIGTEEYGLKLFNVQEKTWTTLVSRNDQPPRAYWSPDGKKIAYLKVV